MSKLKRVLAMLLTVAALLGMLPTAALASEAEATPEETASAETEAFETPEEAEAPDQAEEGVVPAADAADSGTCGDDLTWTLDKEGILTISGTGAIEERAFEARDDVKQVIMEDGVTSVGLYAFHKCSNLTGVTIPTSVTALEEGAFANCSRLADLAIPSSVTELGNFVFGNCTSLTGMILPDGVTYIGGGAFQGCVSLTSITIGSGVTGIGTSAFDGCSSLTSVTLPNGLASIDDWAFRGCTDLSSVTIPDSVTQLRIHDGAFVDCPSLTSVTIPAGVTYIEAGALGYLTDDSGNETRNPDFTIRGYKGTAAEEYAKNNNIPFVSLDTPPADIVASGACGDNLTWTLDKSGTLTISGTGKMYDFMNEPVPWKDRKNEITAVVMEEGVTNISEFAFRDCTNLASVSIADGVTSIGEAAFGNCDSLISVEIPDSVTFICYEAFRGCDSLTSVTISNGVSKLEERVFYYCISLTDVKLPDHLTSIGKEAFYQCGSLTSVAIPDSVTEVGEGAFSGCSDLTDVTISSGLKTLSKEMFQDCFSLTRVVIPEGVKTIEERAFYNCTGLAEVTFPDSLNTIKTEAFYECPKLSSVTLSAAVSTIDTNALGYVYDSDEGKSVVTPGFTIRGYSGSAANYYALNNGITFVSIGTTKLDTPRLIGIKNAENGVVLSWEDVDHAVDYAVFRKAQGEKKWTRVEVAPWHNYLDKNVKSDTVYTYTVRCYDEHLNKCVSDYDTKGLTIHYLAAPHLTKLVKNSTGLRLTWTAADKAAKYRVYRKAYGERRWSRVGITTGTSWQDKQAVGGTAYTVRSVSADGKTYSGYNEYGLAYLDTPRLTRLENTKDGVKVTWGKVTGAGWYRVFRKLPGARNWSVVTTTMATSVLDRQVSDGKTYLYTVRCYDHPNNVFSSGYDTKGKQIVRLATPELLAVENAATGVKVTWKPVTGATKYRVYYKKDGTNWSSKDYKETTGTSITIREGDSGTTYAYTVRAVNGSSLGSYDRTGLKIVKLDAPVITLRNSATGVTVSWDKVPGARGYQIYRRTMDRGYAPIHTIEDGDTLRYNDTTVRDANGTTYVYAVRACGGTLSSFRGATIVRLTVPTISSAESSGKGAMTVAWNANTDATGYQVYYKIGSTGKFVTVKGNTYLSKTITGLSKGSYSVYVRSFKTVDGKNYYSGYSAAAAVTIS